MNFLSKFLFKVLNKAQISIFVIIGVIILIIGILALTLFSSSSIFQAETPGVRVQEFTQQCLLQQADFALNEVAKKGGWYYTRGIETYARPNDFNPLINRAQGFEHIFYGNLKYWDYFDETSNQYRNQIPTLDNENDEFSIRNQVIRLIEETVNEHCLQDFASFSEVYNVDRDLMKLQVSSSSFEQNRIVFELYLPVQVESLDGSTLESLERFRIDIENKIRVPYLIANDIILAQQELSFIENAYLDFIYNYQKTGDDNFLPPFYDFKYGVTDYSVIYAEDKKPLLQRIFNSHSRELIVTDLALTPNQENTIVQTQSSIFKPVEIHHGPLFSRLDGSMLRTQRLNREYSRFVANLHYEPFFPISFSFSNGKGSGQVLTHSVFNEVLLIVPIQYTTYQAGYDVTVPVLYEIRDGLNQRDDGFVFNLPLEVNIRNNNPLRALIEGDYRLNSLQTQESFTATYCNPNHFISQDVSVEVSSLNRFDEREPLEDVLFLFYCSTQPQTACQIPVQETIERFSSNEYVLKLPINCPNSQLEIIREGYLNQKVEITPTLEEPTREQVTMITPKTLDLFFSVMGRSVQPNQEAFILFEPINNPEFIQVISINSTTDMSSLNITLVPDTYKITSFVLDRSRVTIPKKEGRKCKWYEIGCKDAPDLPEFDLDGWVISSFELENYVVTFNDLQFARRVIAQLPGVTYPQSYDDFDQEMPRAEIKHIQIN
ncbi:MAG: hypothetical protein LAT82_01455 [Nanoarchaeota archaeon]|nr:hypothetical protein [Nanoarchaeota archaeon]